MIRGLFVNLSAVNARFFLVKNCTVKIIIESLNFIATINMVNLNDVKNCFLPFKWAIFDGFI